MESLTAKLVDLNARQIRPVRMTWQSGVIESIEPAADSDAATFILPGFVDSHIHIESSMLVPSQFARMAVRHGTVATVSDPHEIANVLGLEGVHFMIDDAAKVPFKFFFGAPSCVPATRFETAGAVLGSESIKALLDHQGIHYLAEMMNYPGVLGGDQEVVAKITAALDRGMLVDGHAPGLRGADAQKYFEAGISTDHECFTLEEAMEKAALGAMIQIREGSAARNFEALHPLISSHPEQVMFCSDDKHPDELVCDHIDGVCRRAIDLGHDLFDVLRAACVTPVQHYGLPVGQMRVGDPADFIEIGSIQKLDVKRTWIDGELIWDGNACCFSSAQAASPNRMDRHEVQIDSLEVKARPAGSIRVIEVDDGQLITRQSVAKPKTYEERVISDVENDVLKIVSVCRYNQEPPAVAFVRGFGLADGAIAGSVGHDSHNLLAVGVTDEAIVTALKAIIKTGGGLSCARETACECLPLPVAGLMSLDSCEEVAARYQQLDRMAKLQGCTLQAPFMTLSFLGLLVIPSLKLSDQGLFDGEKFEFVDLWTG